MNQQFMAQSINHSSQFQSAFRTLLLAVSVQLDSNTYVTCVSRTYLLLVLLSFLSSLQVEDAAKAVASKNNRPDPMLSGSRPLKMRYKPDKV